VFVTSCFDSSVSEGCPEPLLPVAQGLPGDSASRSKARQGVTGASSDSVGAGSQLATGKDIANTISASLYHKSTVVNQDVNNGHLVVEQPLAFDTQFGSNANVFENQSPTLKSSQQPPSVTQYVDSNKPNAVGQNAIPIQDGREIEKNQNGLGIGAEGDPSYTLDQTGAQAVAYSIREDAGANTFSATPLTVTPALQALRPSVQSHHAQTFVADSVKVRRLTPTECERLQGFPDGFTNVPWRKKDTSPEGLRYKALGNSMAVPCMQWIGDGIDLVDKL
jgi:DNA (cytosine-5)-methyltransferase 1